MHSLYILLFVFPSGTVSDACRAHVVTLFGAVDNFKLIRNTKSAAAVTSEDLASYKNQVVAVQQTSGQKTIFQC